MFGDVLPIGTIVEIEGTEPKIIIAGYCPVGSARPGYVWDYAGFLFPLGYRNANEIIQFDKEQITRIVALGYQDEEQFVFAEKLSDAIDVLKDAMNEEVDSKEEGSEEE